MKRTDTEPMSLSFPTPLLGLIDDLTGEGQRTGMVLETVRDVMRRRAWPFKASPANQARLRKHADKVKRKRLATTVTRSLSFEPAELKEVDEHQKMIGEGRSYSVKACLEHALGIKPHPELFEPTLRP